jgi:hypothetical protein
VTDHPDLQEALDVIGDKCIDGVTWQPDYHRVQWPVRLEANGLSPFLSLRGLVFLFAGSGGYQGGRNPAFQTEMLGIDRAVWSDLHTWVSLVMVVTFEGDTLVVQTGEGSVAVHLGPEWYWEAEGINIADGQQVEVTGFYEDDSFEATRVENLDTGAVVTLRDETGRPMWAGRGRQGQGGSSRG